MFQRPTGLGVGIASQNNTSASSAAVLFCARVRTSLRSVSNSAERNVGGFPARNCDGAVRKYGFVVASEIAAGGNELGIQTPSPVGTVPVHGAVNPSLC